MNRISRLLFLAALFSIASPAAAHEFWLEPSNYAPDRGEKVAIDIRVGQFFKGPTYPYFGDSFVNFSVIDGNRILPVESLDGDEPAAKLSLRNRGLAVVTQHTTPLDLTFEKWDKFVSYLKMEGLGHIVARHRKAGKPSTGIKEAYARATKLLLNVGGQGGGNDELTGMPLELVAERNPYALKPGEKLPVRLYYLGKPIAGVQITAIAKSDPETRHNQRTDAQGRVVFALPSAGPRLLNAVHMIEPKPGQDAHWFSYWASMVFARP